jgi:hypothetical protein
MSDPPIEWWKVWFFLSNDPNASLPVFTVSRSIPQPKWRYGVAQTNLHRLQPMSEVIQRLLREGLTGANLQRTFVSRRIQLLRQ